MRGSWNTVPDIPVRFGDPPILALSSPGTSPRLAGAGGSQHRATRVHVGTQLSSIIFCEHRAATRNSTI